MKRGQTEIIGLVVIVILLTLGMLFLAQFALKDNPEKKVFTRKGLAYSTVSALLKATITDPHCNPAIPKANPPTLGQEIIEDCVTHFPPDPFTEFRYQCGGVNSCAYLNKVVPSFLDQTLGQWNKRYEFTITLLPGRGAEPKIILHNESQQGCQHREKDSSGLFPINTGAGLVEVVLFICD